MSVAPLYTPGWSEGEAHLADHAAALASFAGQLVRIRRWGEDFADRLLAGHRLLAAGNGGSAAEAQHLTSELVGRYRAERPPLSAIALHAESSAVTAIVNDYGADAVFARQVRAHGRAGDVLVCLSTSGASPNLLRAVDAGRAAGLRTLALTGPAPNPLAAASDDALAVDAPTTAVVQELHLVAVHLLCAAIDARLAAAPAPTAASALATEVPA